MDKFGYIRGRRGPPGPPGRDAFELQSWCPSAVLEMFRKEEECTFFFNTDKDGLLYDKNGKAIGLKDRYGENNAICQQNFHKPIKVGKNYGIPLNNTLFKNSHVETATSPPSICIIALQFKVSGELTDDKDGYIVCNETLSRGVKINKSNLNILGTDPVELIYNYRDWNTLIIQYTNIHKGNGKCFFLLNDERGTFIPHKTDDASELYIGGTKEKKGFARVVLASLEVYYRVPLPNPYLLSETILDALNYDLGHRTEKN